MAKLGASSRQRSGDYSDSQPTQEPSDDDRESMGVETVSEGDDRTWVDQNSAVVAEAFRLFLESGNWPKVSDLRRSFAQRAQVIDVQAIAQARPRAPGELRSYHQETVSLLFRQLRYVPSAQQLLTVCLAAVRRAVEVYLTRDADPKISSSDTQIAGLAGNNPQLLARAGQLLSAEPIAPLGGGSLGPESWELFINENVIMDFQKLGTFDDFVARQDAIGRKADERRATIQAVLPVQLPDGAVAPDDNGTRRIFVVMPFGPDWSLAVYELIKRAVSALDLEPAAIVERADDITKPGRITQQIVDSIQAAHVVVADITGLNPNVMWELGYAHALERPTVILNQDVGNSPFDLVDQRQVSYKLLATSADEQSITKHLASALGL